MSFYSESLKNPKWQKRRLMVFQRDGWKCTKCGSRERELHAHHLYYLDGRLPWEYPDDAIVTLCQECHMLTHINIVNPDSRPVRHIREVILDLIRGIDA